MTRQQIYTITEVARLLGVPPRKISDLFYAQKIPSDDVQIIGRHRLMPISLLPTIRAALGIMD